MSSVLGIDDGQGGYGVSGQSTRGGRGVYAFSNTGYGVAAYSDTNHAVHGESTIGGIGVFGQCIRGGIGVDGQSDGGTGVRGSSRLGGVGVEGSSDTNYGVKGQSVGKAGVAGISTRGEGVYGKSFDNIGVYGESSESSKNPGVYGISVNGTGVYGESSKNAGVYGLSIDAVGVYGQSVNNVGVYGISEHGLAAFLEGNVEITGNLSVGGILKSGGAFRIDHPLDPANKYLSHSFVESPDMKNVYDGVVTLDDKGETEIELPDWFGALNKDFRYQLTAIGAPGPNLYIAEEISSDATATTTTHYIRTRSHKNKNNSNNSCRFKIAGGISGMKVSWQVTGIRKDPWANAHRIPVEEDKPPKERGYYTYPELYGEEAEKGISHLLFPREEKKELLLINDKLT
jgi:hypothetical protein